MSLITCCPACGTMFKVVPDQLRISDGWVRCGHCAKVFDAAAQLQQHEPTAPQPLAAGQAPDNVESVATARIGDEEPGPAPSAAPGPQQLAAALLQDASTPLARTEPYSKNQQLAYASRNPPSVLLRQDAGPDGPAQPPVEPKPVLESSPAPEPVSKPVPEPESEPEAGPALHDLSFVRQAQRQSLWQRRSARPGLALLALALGALLVVQALIHDRDRLVAAQPGLRPALVVLCRPLKCHIGPPRQIDAILIDSSSFNRLRSDAYRLNFTLKNQAAIEVAMPAIELTLTDTQDQPVVRRVLLPADLGATSGVIPAVAEWSGTLALNVAAGGGAGRIAGYRLLAFYP